MSDNTQHHTHSAKWILQDDPSTGRVIAFYGDLLTLKEAQEEGDQHLKEALITSLAHTQETCKVIFSDLLTFKSTSNYGSLTALLIARIGVFAQSEADQRRWIYMAEHGWLTDSEDAREKLAHLLAKMKDTSRNELHACMTYRLQTDHLIDQTEIIHGWGIQRGLPLILKTIHQHLLERCTPERVHQLADNLELLKLLSP